MINFLRRKMIFVSAISIAVVISLIFLTMYVVGVKRLEDTMDMLTDAISENGGFFPAFDSQHPLPSVGFPQVDIITPETEFSPLFFTIWLDEEYQFIKENVESIYSVTSEQAIQYAQEILERGKDRGWISVYRYKVVEMEHGYSVVFVDGSMNRAMTRQFLLISLVVLAVSSLVILLLIGLFSKKVVRPVAESYENKNSLLQMPIMN